METNRKTHGWSGSVRAFMDQPQSLIEQSLESHLQGLLGFNAAGSQVEAWLEEIEVLKRAFRDLSISKPSCLEWSVVLEYELPLEGGRRPDVIVLGPNKIYVLEFKQDPVLQRSSLDQVAAYARDLAEYHSHSHGIEVIPLLVPTKTVDKSEIRDVVTVLSPDKIAAFLDSADESVPINLDNWLEGDYAPLPTLIAAAKMIFSNERLPAIKRAESYGVAKAVLKLKEIVRDSELNSERALAFVSGVPGAGKTLVGLQFVYEESNQDSQAIFLSGNGPLVEVLRDALKSKAFVSDLHAFIKSYGTTSKVPKQHIIVFDEAQRAWDASNMMVKKGVAYSEPELLVAIGERIPEWTALVGLIGHGQEIHTGEEAGISGWFDAIESQHAKSDWKVYSPPRFSKSFPNHSITECEELDLNHSLRSKQAEYLHDWVQCLLTGQLAEASRISQKIWVQNFPIFITRDLDLAKNYVTERFDGESSKRYGIIASSKDRILPQYGINNGFHETKQVKNAKWYNNNLGEPGSCCNMEEVVTEFGCQGLELDMAIVAWGNDYLWDGASWQMRKMRTRIPQQDPHQLRLNSYRVLLTRSREGLIIFVPPLSEFDQTEHAFLAAGARILESQISLAEIS
jgi:Uncharacterized conserved protein (DUF2075)